MSNTKHTPGPWTFNKVSQFKVLHSKIETKDFTICHVIGDGNGEHEGEADANAKLIAAAPDMKAALEQLVHLHLCEQEGLQSGQPTREQWLKAVDDASKALAKTE